MKCGLDVLTLEGSFSSMMGGTRECLRGTWVIGAILGKIVGSGWSLAGNDY